MGIGRSRRENRKARHTARPAAVLLPSPVSAIYRRFFGRPAPTPGILLCPSRQCRQEFSGESRKTEEPSRSNLWRLGSCSVRRQQVAPGTARVGNADRQSTKNFVDSQTLAAPAYGGQRSSTEPAAATGCRLSLPGGSRWLRALPESATPTVNPRRISWIRRPWPLQPMAANGRRQNPRQQPGAGSACPAAAGGSGHCPADQTQPACVTVRFLPSEVIVTSPRRVSSTAAPASSKRCTVSSFSGSSSELVITA